MARRPPKQERAAETRERILTATVQSLIERGYTGTTTTGVCELAGVSRGAYGYHFATKLELVTATVQHLFERRSAEFHTAISHLPQGGDRYDAAVDLLWQTFSGETFLAWLEVAVAARTDPELHEHVRPLNARIQATVEEHFAELFPELAGVPQFAAMPDFVFSLLEGLALGAAIQYRGEERVAAVLGSLKLLGDMLERVRALLGLDPSA